jgi:cell division protein FtsI/penicillin-binding protein 2
MNLPANSLYASPTEIKDSDKEKIIRELSRVLNLKQPYLRDRLQKKKSFIWIARKITQEQVEAIKKLDIKGLGFIKEGKRSYPNAYLASQVIGFTGLDNIGLEGLELMFDKYLRGLPGWALFLRDARQKKLDLWEKMVLPKDGYDLILTIDEVIQYIAERELDKAYRVHHAKGASIVVIDPFSGAILALANRPLYDLNDRSVTFPTCHLEKRSDEGFDVTNSCMRNRAICDLFEPGSVFKIVTAAAALEEKKVFEEDKFFCENGAWKYSTHILHDHKPHGWLTFRQVIEQSSNIGTAKVAQLLGPDLLYKYIKQFGFGSKLGIDLAGEISGIARPPHFWSKISLITIPIGQEVGATALQLVSAISVIANGGKLMKPYVVKEVRDKHGQLIEKFSPQLIRKVISLDTSLRLKKILTGVIEEGTGKLAKISGFSAAGKTGTAQKLEPDGRYSHNKFVSSFVGFAPAEDPLIAVVVTVDEPHPYYFGGVVAAPVFKNVASDVLRYLKAKQLQKPLVHLRGGQG